MKVFITGATGYIGHELATELIRRNYEVAALVRSREKAADLAALGVQLFIGDLGDKQAIEQAMQGAEVVFHLAAFARMWPEDEHLYRRINVAGTETILDLALKSTIKKVVFTSTASVYGPSAGSPVNETTRRIAPFTNLYERSKAEAEQIARDYNAKGLPVVILNPTRVYGPGIESESNATRKLLQLYLQGKWRFIPGDGTRIGNYAFIRDVVDGHILAMEKGRSGENYLLGGEDASYNRFFDLVKQQSGQPKWLFHIPAPLLMTISRSIAFGARMTNNKPLITPEWAKKYLSDWSVSSQKATQELGYSITPLEKGLQEPLRILQQT
jgi:nucleoside-diphosphate-sugar epimerase